MKVRWLLKAVNDLEYLHEYIARDNPTAASRQVDLILEAAARLSENANMGRRGRVKGNNLPGHNSDKPEPKRNIE